MKNSNVKKVKRLNDLPLLFTFKRQLIQEPKHFRKEINKREQSKYKKDLYLCAKWFMIVTNRAVQPARLDRFAYPTH